jgi:hypothetical protein
MFFKAKSRSKGSGSDGTRSPNRAASRSSSTSTSSPNRRGARNPKTISVADGDYPGRQHRVRIRAPTSSSTSTCDAFQEYIAELFSIGGSDQNRVPEWLVLSDGAAVALDPEIIYPRVKSNDKCVLLFASRMSHLCPTTHCHSLIVVTCATD